MRLVGKKALVLAGGGTRGSYQCGALAALLKLGETWDIITGTSIGALNGTLMVQHDYEAMMSMWQNLAQEQIYNGGVSLDLHLETLINEKNLIPSFFKNYFKEKGVDNEPFCHMVHKLYNPERFQKSDIDFGCITVKHLTQTPVYVDKKMMAEDGENYLIATASCFPAFPIHKFGGQEYVDGGYFDNMPIDYALRKGADEIIAVDLNQDPQHPNFIERPHINYILPLIDTGFILSFDHETIDRNILCGYNDVMKRYDRLSGVKYSYEKQSTPGWFEQYFIDCLKLETRIRIASKLRGPSFLTDKLSQQQHRKVLSTAEFAYGIMDSLMDLCGANVARVYRFEEAEQLLLSSFEDAFAEDYMLMPSLDIKEIAAYTKTLDQKGIVAKLVHQNLYPSHVIFSENIVLTTYPYEQAMADFITLMKLA
jgi:NTE family protein